MAEFEYRVMIRQADGTVAVFGQGGLNEGSARSLLDRWKDDREWWIERRPFGAWERVSQ